MDRIGQSELTTANKILIQPYAFASLLDTYITQTSQPGLNIEIIRTIDEILAALKSNPSEGIAADLQDIQNRKKL
jgi:hypothetical protein